MNKTASIILTFALIAGVGIIFWGGSGGSGSENNVEIRNGIQYVTVKAAGGYFPSVSSAQADIPTKLIMKTTGSFDCSAALVIRSVGYQQILPRTGETEIDIGIPKAGEPLQGLCSMGMYSFVVNFD
jgi:plastocyanin domain-containing protein